MARQHETKKPIYWALAGNLLIALTKLIAAVYTGSSAMLSEAVHSLIDTGNEVLLLYGLHRASLPSGRRRPTLSAMAASSISGASSSPS